jgi:hypothetical protein
MIYLLIDDDLNKVGEMYGIFQLIQAMHLMNEQDISEQAYQVNYHKTCSVVHYFIL